VWVKETWHGRTGSLDDAFKREYVRIFSVKVDSIYDGPQVILSATGVPRIWDPYVTATDADLGALCKKLDPRQTDTRNLWELQADYSSEVKEQSQQAQNPLDRPAEIEWSFAKYQKAVDRDIYGKAIRNSAGLPFDPPPEIDEGRPILTINRNEATFNFANAYAYQDAVNQDTFFGAPPGGFRVNNIRGRRQYENGLSFWAVTYEFEYRGETWFYRPMDRGKTQVDPADGKLVAIADKYGQPVTEPVPLDGHGQPLSEAATTISLSTPIDAGAINVLVVDPTVFSAALPFVVTVDDEDMQVTSFAGNVLTVTRGFNGTTAAAHAAGAAVRQAPYFLTFEVYRALPFAPLGLP
jgi:hypothetical protein